MISRRAAGRLAEETRSLRLPMEHWTEYTRFFTALLVILDPFLAIPIFLSLTTGYSRAERARVARIAVTTVASVLIVSALVGDTLLRWMGTSLPSFRVGGGIVLFLMALAMLQARDDPVRTSPRESMPSSERATVAVVPLGIPLLAGPGAISTVIIAMDRSHAAYHGPLLILCMLLVCAVLWVALRLAEPIGGRLGDMGLHVINRLFGLILVAIAVEIAANGLRQLFPSLGG